MTNCNIISTICKRKLFGCEVLAERGSILPMWQPCVSSDFLFAEHVLPPPARGQLDRKVCTWTPGQFNPSMTLYHMCTARISYLPSQTLALFVAVFFGNQIDFGVHPANILPTGHRGLTPGVKAAWHEADNFTWTSSSAELKIRCTLMPPFLLTHP